MREARIWVVIADGEIARICSSSDGTTTVVLAPAIDDAPSCELDSERTARTHRIWYGRENRHCFFARGAEQQFAGHIAQILLEAAREHAYDGLVVVAKPEIEAELRRALAPETRARLIGEVIRDLPHARSDEPAEPAPIRH
jgi:protein required for attachment to host cells